MHGEPVDELEQQFAHVLEIMSNNSKFLLNLTQSSIDSRLSRLRLVPWTIEVACSKPSLVPNQWDAIITNDKQEVRSDLRFPAGLIDVNGVRMFLRLLESNSPRIPRN